MINPNGKDSTIQRSKTRSKLKKQNESDDDPRYPMLGKVDEVWSGYIARKYGLGEIHINRSHGKEELTKNLLIAELFAEFGHIVRLLPIFDNIKNADITIDSGLIYELKEPRMTKSAVHRALREGSQQARRVMLNLKGRAIDSNLLKSYLFSWLNNYSERLIEIVIIFDNATIVKTVEELKKGDWGF